jgi:hypothetical protein
LFYRARIGSRAFYVLIGYYKKYHTIFPYNHPQVSPLGTELREGQPPT